MNSEVIEKQENAKSSRPWVKYLVTAGIGALAIFLVLLSRGIFSAELTEADRIKHLSDSFFLVGLLIACFGGLLFVSGEGAFDGLGFAFRSLTWFFTFKKKHESYAEYKERKHGGKRKSFLFLIVVGLFYVAIGGIFNVMFLSKFT